VNGTVLEELGNFKLEVVMHQSKPSTSKPKLTGRSFTEKVRIRIDLSQARKLVKHLDGEKGIETAAVLLAEPQDKKEGSAGKDEEDAAEGEVEPAKQESGDAVVKQLDLLVAYLREVHLFEYYSGEEFLDRSDLERKHPGGFCRNRAPERQREHYRETKQEGQLDHKTRMRLDRKWVLELRLGEEFVERAMDRWFEDNITKVGDNKYGNKFSNKLFREPKFVRKHIMNKHEAKYKEQLERVTKDLYFNNYFSDPVRIRPPPPPGTFPAPGFNSRRETPPGGRYGKGGYDRGGYDRGSPRMRGRSPPRRGRSPPRSGGRRESYGTPKGGDPRGLHVYNDLDGATDDLQPLDFDDLDLPPSDTI